MSRGSKYSDQQRRAAVLEYSGCGCLATVSETIGIPRKTLSDWMRSNWWDQLTAEVRRVESEPVSRGEVGEVKKNKVGRPTSFKPEYAEQAKKLCLLGATDQDMADFFQVTEQSVNNWKDAQPEFFESMRLGKIEADANVATSLYKRATGSSHPETRITQVQGKIVETTITKHYPPDTQAMGLWLKNRRPKSWRDDKHITMDVSEKHELIVQLPQILQDKLSAARGEVLGDVIEGEVIEE